MHELAALKEYLGDVLTEVVPKEGRKSRKAEQAKARLEHVVSFLFKAPINLVKHERFKLYWLAQSNESGATSGFSVTGMIAPRTTGPASYRTKNVAEGYSFALFLRQVLPTIYQLCAIADATLAESGLVESASQNANQGEPSDPRMLQLAGVLGDLAQLSCRGFPNEVGTRVAELSLLERQVVVARTFKLQGFGLRWRVHFTFPGGKAGDMFQLPYWVPPKE